jgi:NADH:ubiquinone oxidoreductase subunit E
MTAHQPDSELRFVSKNTENIRGNKGKAPVTTSEHDLDEGLAAFAPERTNLLPALHLVQETLGYLPSWALQRVSRQLHIPASEVHGVASGYTEFRFEPPPDGLIQVCTGLSCRIAGAGALLEQARARRPEAVETIPCVFLCSLAPVVARGERFIGHVDAATLAEVQGNG